MYFAVIARVPETENAPQEKQLATTILTKMYQLIVDIDDKTKCPTSFEELLKKANLTKEQYEYALKIAIKRSHLVMKRSPCDIFINNYNPVLLRALR